MEVSFNAQRLLRLSGFLTWGLAGLPLLVKLCGTPAYLTQGRYTLWLGAFFIFGITFGLTSWDADNTSFSWRRLASLTVQTAAALVMIYLVCTGYEGALLVIVALQLGWLLPLPKALAWALAQSVLMGWIIAAREHPRAALSLLTAYLGFEALALFSAHFAASEFRARTDLSRANAELRAAQQLLVDSSRMAERQRISRELHDVMGHHLTALSLNLEVASHVAADRALDHIRSAQSLTKLLLRDVRGVVRSMRDEGAVDIARAMRALVEGVPGPQIHLLISDDLEIDDPLRAHTLVRCAQEIITNTVKHAGADNLWIEFTKTAEGVRISARDDGRGVRQIRPGFGLTGMRERLEELGGRLQVESELDRGFRVQAWVPLPGVAS